ncbi:MAG: 3D domain-containing protein [Lachnospiraceae bacterium]|nr:3D domain-containing protein [Lachnospiraceae bacterium]
MEKQLEQFVNNVKVFCKRILMLMVSASFACAALITANGEAAKNVLPFKQVALSECTQDEQEYAFGNIQHEDYYTIQNHLLVAEALSAAGAIEPEAADVEAKATEVVAQSYQAVSGSPVYADPAMNGYECLGTYLTTGYCPCAACCGKTNGVTASGAIAQTNHTIAADTGVLPFGTQVVINGKVYTVEDRGGAIRGNRIDIFFGSHQEALNYGKQTVRVYRYVGTSENASSVMMETVSETPDIEMTTTEASTEEGSTASTESSSKNSTETEGNTSSSASATQAEQESTTTEAAK